MTDAPPDRTPDETPDETFDATGMLCPLPVIELARRIAAVPVGGTIAVRCDDPAAASDIPAWCRMRGHAYLGATPADAGVTSYLVRRLG